jgi:hypothetical protein
MNIYVVENQAYATAQEAINALANLTTKRADIYYVPSLASWDEAKAFGENPYDYFPRIDSKSREQLV